jgi:hypothetical protein
MNEKPILFSAEMVRAILDGRKNQTRRVMKSQPPNRTENGTPYIGYQPTTLPISEGYDLTAYLDNPQYIGKCPYGQPGDRLWVKETHFKYGKWIKDGFTTKGKQRWRFRALTAECRYLDNPPPDVKPSNYRNEAWYRRPSIFMRRADSRITLGITSIRIERVQDISEEDARAEGCEVEPNRPLWTVLKKDGGTYQCFAKPQPDTEIQSVALSVLEGRSASEEFRYLWESINAKRKGGIYTWKRNPWIWAISFRRINAGEGKE